MKDHSCAFYSCYRAARITFGDKTQTFAPISNYLRFNLSTFCLIFGKINSTILLVYFSMCLYCRWKHAHHNLIAANIILRKTTLFLVINMAFPDMMLGTMSARILSVYSSDLAGYSYWSDFNETWPDVSPDISPSKYEVCYSFQQVKTIK